MASDAYWNATKPAGMPDYIWQQQQATKKAEEAKKASSTYNTAKQTVANTKPTSYNTAQYYAAQALQNAGQTVPKPDRTHSGGSERIPNDSGTVNNALTNAVKNAVAGVAAPVASTVNNAMTDAVKNAVVGGTTPIANAVSNALDEAAKNSMAGVMTGISNLIDNNSNGSNKGGDNTSDALKDAAIDAVVGGVIGTGVTNPSNNNGGGGGGGYIGGGSSSGSAPSGGYYNGANWSGGMSYKPYPTAEDMAGYVSTIIQAAKKELGDVISPKYMDAKAPDAPELRTLEDLANTFGITYDYDSIYKILNDSVEKQYDAIYQRQKQNEDAYYDNAAAAQNTLLDTLSRDRSNAVSAGVSKGMQAANALGAMLGVSQQFANNATALSQERSNTAKDYGASLAKAVVDAEATSNERKNAIMEIAKMLYGYDSEQYVANMDNYSTILTNNAALQQSYMNNHTALQNALASIFGGVANNKIMGDANVQSSTLAAEAQKAAAQYAAAAQQYAAQQSYLSNQAIADANKYAADINYQLGLLDYQNKQNALANNEAPLATGTGSSSTTTSTKAPSAYTNAANLGNNLASSLILNMFNK